VEIAFLVWDDNFNKFKELRLRNFSGKHIFPWKSQFTNASPDFPTHEGVLLIPFNYKTQGHIQHGRETDIKLLCAGTTTVKPRSFPDVSFSRIHHSISVVPEQFLFKLWK
jgi:hypothetical protein